MCPQVEMRRTHTSIHWQMIHWYTQAYLGWTHQASLHFSVCVCVWTAIYSLMKHRTWCIFILQQWYKFNFLQCAVVALACAHPKLLVVGILNWTLLLTMGHYISATVLVATRVHAVISQCSLIPDSSVQKQVAKLVFYLFKLWSKVIDCAHKGHHKTVF